MVVCFWGTEENYCSQQTSGREHICTVKGPFLKWIDVLTEIVDFIDESGGGEMLN